MTSTPDIEGFQEALSCIDQMIGKYWTDFAVEANREHSMIRLRGRCRLCQEDLIAAKSYREDSWSTKLVELFLEYTAKHTREHSLVGEH